MLGEAPFPSYFDFLEKETAAWKEGELPCTVSSALPRQFWEEDCRVTQRGWILSLPVKASLTLCLASPRVKIFISAEFSGGKVSTERRVLSVCSSGC